MLHIRQTRRVKAPRLIALNKITGAWDRAKLWQPLSSQLQASDFNVNLAGRASGAPEVEQLFFKSPATSLKEREDDFDVDETGEADFFPNCDINI